MKPIPGRGLFFIVVWAATVVLLIAMIYGQYHDWHTPMHFNHYNEAWVELVGLSIVVVGYPFILMRVMRKVWKYESQ